MGLDARMRGEREVSQCLPKDLADQAHCHGVCSVSVGPLLSCVDEFEVNPAPLLGANPKPKTDVHGAEDEN